MKEDMKEIDKKNTINREELIKESSALQKRLSEINKIFNDIYRQEIEEKLKLYEGKIWLLFPELLTKELDELEDFEYQSVIAVNPTHQGFSRNFVCEKVCVFETNDQVKIYKDYDVNIFDFDNAVEITKEQVQEVLCKLAKSLI